MNQVVGKRDLQSELITAFTAIEQSDFANTWINSVRKDAIAAFERKGLPGNKSEEYKYTPITKVLEKDFQVNFVEPKTTLDKQDISSLLIDNLEANIVVFINGYFSSALSKIISSEKELSILGLLEAEKRFPEEIKKHYGNNASYETDAFTALNTAFAQDGACIIVPNRTSVSYPIIFHYINDSAVSNKNMVHPRTLVVMGEGSEVDIIESFHTIGPEKSFVNIVTEIVLEDNSIVRYTKINNESDKAYHLGNTHICQSKGSTFTANTMSFGGAMVRNNLNIIVDGEGAEANMNGLYILNGNQHVDNHTMVDHKRPNTTSNELYKGIIDGQANAVFNGKIYVRQIAQKTNAFQSNKNILLSDDASINTKPQLEIWADDVKCSHGATTGQLDNEQMFYLRSRGLSEESARSMLLYAFATDVIEDIKISALKHYLEKKISDRLRKEF